MATLVSPGVSITLEDDTIGTPSGPGTIPLIVVATGTNKTHVSDTGIAEGTLPENANKTYLITSQTELIQTYGEPTFYSVDGTPRQAYELNEFGLLAAYQYLGIANQALVLRAGVDLNQLQPSVFEPTQQALSGTYWLDDSLTQFGIFTSNGNSVPGLAWTNKKPIVVDSADEVETLLLGDVGFNATSVTPLTASGVLQVNGTNVSLLNTDTVANVVAKINLANIPNIKASTLFYASKYYILLTNTAGGDITLSIATGSPILADLGLFGVQEYTAPKQSLGLEKDYAIVTKSADNVIYQKLTPKDNFGNNIIGSTPFWFVVGSTSWKAATPTVVVGSTNPLPYSAGDDITINDGTNSVTVTFTGTTVASAVTNINNAIAALAPSARPSILASQQGNAIVISNTQGGDVTITDIGNQVVGVNITNAGTNYTSLPMVSFSGGGGIGAAADQISALQDVSVITRGSGYTVGDVLNVLGGTIQTAGGTIQVANVENYLFLNPTTIAVNNPGSGYTPGTYVVQMNTGTSDVEPTLSITVNGSGIVSGVSVLDPGYVVSAPTSPLLDTQLVGTNWPNTGSGASFNVTFSSYQSAATVGIVNAGANYAVGDVLTLGAGVYNYPGQVTVTAIATGGLITGVTVSNPGEYRTAPVGSNTATGGSGTGAQFSVTPIASTGMIKTVFVSTGGTYTSVPSNPINTTGGTGKGGTFNVTSGLINSGVKLKVVGTPSVVDPGQGYVIGDFVQGNTGVFSQAVRLKVLSTQSYNRFGNFTIANPGTGYSIGDIVTVGGGSFTQAAQLVVTSVGALNGIASADVYLGGSYIAAPTGTLSGATPVSGGSGYTVGDLLSVNGGTATLPGTLQVASVDLSGAVTSVTAVAGSIYTVPPTGTTSVTGGTGLGATFNLSFTASSIAGGTGTGAQVFGPISAVDGGVGSVQVINAGAYTVLPSQPTLMSTTGAGTSARFSFNWGVGLISMTSGGDGYTSAPMVMISGGGGTGATGTAVLGANTQTLTNLGLYSLKGNRLFYSPHYNVPSGSVVGDAWVKTTSPNNGAQYIVKVYSRTTGQWTTVSAPLYANDDEASLALGTTAAAGTLYVQYNLYGTVANPIASQTIKTWGGPAQFQVLGNVTNPSVTPGDEFSITALDQNKNQVTINVLLNGPDLTQTLIDINNALSVANVTNISASQLNGKIVISNTLNLSMTFENTNGTPLTDLGIAEGLQSNWSILVYVAQPTEPTTQAASGTLWYNPDFRADIMVSDGDEWKGYRVAYPATDPNGPILAASAPTVQSTGNALQENDIWIDTNQADLESYPKIYRWRTVGSFWELVDNTDQTTPFGIVFADARWNVDGQLGSSEDIADIVLSNYVDPDLELNRDPRTAPDGMLLFNTRYSSYNVKQWLPDYLSDYIGLSYDVGAATFPAGTITADNDGRWVTTSGNQLNGAPYMGRKAQRAVIVRSMQAALAGNTDIRAENVYFNIMAAPGYPELIDEMVSLNVDKKQIAFIVGDTPARLTPDSTSLQNWATNANNAGTNGEDGLLTHDTYLAVYYPWGLSTDFSGNDVMIPPSAMALRTLAYNDQVAYPWFAPAGYTRGLVSNATSVGYLTSEGEYQPVSLSQGQRDVLYTNNINPIANFSGRGLVIWGEKTLNPVASALDRINVVRLVNYLRYNLDIIARPYLFEPNDKQTRDQVTVTFDRFLANLVTLRALSDYAVVCDESNNTPDRIDRNELWIDVAIAPTRTIEFIYIPIRIRPTGSNLTQSITTNGTDTVGQ